MRELALQRRRDGEHGTASSGQAESADRPPGYSSADHVRVPAPTTSRSRTARQIHRQRRERAADQQRRTAPGPRRCRPTSRSDLAVHVLCRTTYRAVRDGRRGHSGGVESHIVFVVTTRKSISERFVQLIYEQVI